MIFVGILTNPPETAAERKEGPFPGVLYAVLALAGTQNSNSVRR